jgi:hypothetical protein
MRALRPGNEGHYWAEAEARIARAQARDDRLGLAGQLAQLAGLHIIGALSKSEYAAAKARVLAA